MKKRMLALLLAAVLLLGMIPLASAAEPEAVLPAAQSTEDASPAASTEETASGPKNPLPDGFSITYQLNDAEQTATAEWIGTSTFTQYGTAYNDVWVISLPYGASDVTGTAPTNYGTTSKKWSSLLFGKDEGLHLPSGPVPPAG